MPPFSTQTVLAIVDQAVRGDLDVPEFQREFVWRPDQVCALVDSLHRDYPIGQILTWERPGYGESRSAADAQSTKRWLVDGQQRTTALCLVFGRKPYWWSDAASWNRRLAATDVLVNVCAAANGLQFGLANPIRSQDPKWVSVRNVLALSGNPTGPAGDAALAELADSVARRLPGKLATKYPKEAVAGRLRTVLDIANRPVAVADVHHDVEDVAEIFTRLNQQGTGVTEADVSLAVAATQHGGWVREEFLPFLRNLEESGYEVDPGVAIRVLTGGGEGHVRLGEVPREFWSSEGFGAAWENTRESLSAIVSGLVGSGVLSSALLPSQTALVPFALLHMKHGARGFLFPRALHWYLMACRDSRYSGSSSSTLSEDVRIVREATDFAEAIQALRGALEVEFRLTPDEFLARSTWSRPLLLIVYLTLASRKATDWATGLPLGQPRAEGAVEYGFAPHWHSLFPRSRAVLRSPRYDYTPDEVGAVANLVALNDRAKDRRWSSTPPSKYLETARVTDEQLTQQLVPLDHDLWDPDRYRDFLAARAAQLASACNDYLARLVGSAR